MLTEAERVLHDRAVVACEAATMAGLPGTFRAWREDGLLAVLATASCWDGDRPTLVLPAGLVPHDMGLVPDGVRPIAVLPLTGLPPPGADVDVFLRILLDGYAAPEPRSTCDRLSGLGEFAQAEGQDEQHHAVQQGVDPDQQRDSERAGQRVEHDHDARDERERAGRDEESLALDLLA